MPVCRGDLAGNENADKVRHAAQLGYVKLATQSSASMLSRREAPLDKASDVACSAL